MTRIFKVSFEVSKADSDDTLDVASYNVSTSEDAQDAMELAIDEAEEQYASFLADGEELAPIFITSVELLAEAAIEGE